MIYDREGITIDMWDVDGGRRFTEGKFSASAHFNQKDKTGVCYRGTIYDENGKAIGDYAAAASEPIEKMFKINWD